jgi:DNA-binding response OmpR family regulator
VVTRDEMLGEVWRTSFSGSNIVEAVVRSLRKKLGAFAPSIETVTGHGYRFHGWKRRD